MAPLIQLCISMLIYLFKYITYHSFRIMCMDIYSHTHKTNKQRQKATNVWMNCDGIVKDTKNTEV